MHPKPEGARPMEKVLDEGQDWMFRKLVLGRTDRDLCIVHFSDVPGGKPCIYPSRAKVSPQPANQSAKQSAPLPEDRYVKLPGASREGAQSKLKLAESEKKVGESWCRCTCKVKSSMTSQSEESR